MIEKLKKFLFTDTHPTVYDQEAGTVLQLCGRLLGKMNQCVDIVNESRADVNEMVDKVNGALDDLELGVSERIKAAVTTELMSGNLRFGLYPSGDTSGATDAANIQKALNATGTCILNEGTFYINTPIKLRAGFSVEGRGNTATNICTVNCGAFEMSSGISCDHLTMRDFKLTTTNEGVNTAFSIVGAGAAPYDGARYSLFENVEIVGFAMGVFMRGAWGVNFKHCRFNCSNYGVFQQGTCNNNVYDHCAFLALNEGTGTGANIAANGGAQNCGISFIDCDFERWEIAVQAYCVVGLNVKNIYAEGVTTVFKVDSCPNFNVDGGYASYIKRLATVAVSNTATIYANGRGCIANVFCRFITEDNVHSTGNAYLTNVPDPITYLLEMRNVGAEDVSGNNTPIFYYDRDLTQTYGAGYDYDLNNLVGSSGYIAAGENKMVVSCAKRFNVKVLKMQLHFPNAFTASTGGVVTIKDAEGRDIYTFNITAGQTYAAGTMLNGTPHNAPLIYDPANTSLLTFTASTTTGTMPQAQLVASIVRGEMIASKKITN